MCMFCLILWGTIMLYNVYRLYKIIIMMQITLNIHTHNIGFLFTPFAFFEEPDFMYISTSFSCFCTTASSL